MLIANNPNGEPMSAWLVHASDGPFFCPGCKRHLILKKGRIKADHFAHEPYVSCIYGFGETQEHMEAKRSIFEALSQRPNCSKCQLERHLDGVRPDVSLYINKTPVAIEFQRSNIDISEIERRIAQYTHLKIHLLWLLPYPKLTDEGLYRSPIWTNYLHSTYFGRLYFWFKGAQVFAAHLKTHKSWVEETTWYEDGFEQGGGGYYRDLKRLKKFERCPDLLDIADDFCAQVRPPHRMKHYELLNCRLWIDRQPMWWENEKEF